MDYKEKVIALLNSKELSQEQKEKLESIFPELDESYSEKIRKELIEHIKVNQEADYVLFKKFPPDDVITWLENQGEQNTLNADKVIEWLKPYGCVVDNIVDQFKKDFGL